MFLKFLPLAKITAADSVTAKTQYGWESVGLALLLVLGLIGGLMLTQAINRWLIRQMTRSGTEPERRDPTGAAENRGKHGTRPVRGRLAPPLELDL